MQLANCRNVRARTVIYYKREQIVRIGFGHRTPAGEVFATEWAFKPHLAFAPTALFVCRPERLSRSAHF